MKPRQSNILTQTALSNKVSSTKPGHNLEGKCNLVVGNWFTQPYCITRPPALHIIIGRSTLVRLTTTIQQCYYIWWDNVNLAVEIESSLKPKIPLHVLYFTVNLIHPLNIPPTYPTFLVWYIYIWSERKETRRSRRQLVANSRFCPDN